MRVLKIFLIIIFFPLLHAIVQWLYYLVFDLYLEKMFGKEEAEKLMSGRFQSVRRFFYWDIKDKLNPFHYVLYWISHITFIVIVVLMILRVFEVQYAAQYASWTGVIYFLVLYSLRVSTGKKK
jgi:hypothetical protein